MPPNEFTRSKKNKILARMPPPSYCSRISTRSTGDHEPDIDTNVKTDVSSTSGSSSEDESKGDASRYDGVGIVKSLLGPSFEDAVLRTFEFGKSLIQKAEENEQGFIKNKKHGRRKFKAEKEISQCSLYKNDDFFDEKTNSSPRSTLTKINDGRFTRKRIVFTAKLDKEPPPPPFKSPPPSFAQKFAHVSKIRSLDSDLKRLAPSPEKIKRQLEALIQINKDEPPEHAGFRLFPQKTSKFHSEITVMPSLCLNKNEIDVQPCSSGEGQSVKKGSEDGQSSTSKGRIGQKNAKKKSSGSQSGICQAPEFLTSALGPTLDVSIIENLKMMRNLFKCDNEKGEGAGSPGAKPAPSSGGGTTSVIPSVGICAQASSPRPNEATSAIEGLQCRLAALKSRVEELQQKEQCLMKQIEEEEKERECKRRAFEEEEKKLCNMKACLEGLMEEERRRNCGQDCMDYETKYENLRQKIACEEEKLARLKDQHDCYKREILEAKNRKEALKRNKSLLDAWDVIASKACHTRLPSYSRAPDLERKQLKAGDNVGNLHCCFMPQVVSTPNEGDCGKIKSRGSSVNIDICCSKEKPSSCCTLKKEEPAFPIQRDVICGLHKPLKPCCCSGGPKGEASMYASDDELLKMSGPAPVPGKSVCRSRSETLLKKDACAKIVKVLWAITRINVFQDNCKTYEVMDATSTPPPCAPVKTEGIFVVKNSDKKGCHQKRRCGP